MVSMNSDETRFFTAWSWNGKGIGIKITTLSDNFGGLRGRSNSGACIYADLVSFTILAERLFPNDCYIWKNKVNTNLIFKNVISSITIVKTIIFDTRLGIYGHLRSSTTDPTHQNYKFLLLLLSRTLCHFTWYDNKKLWANRVAETNWYFFLIFSQNLWKLIISTKNIDPSSFLSPVQTHTHTPPQKKIQIEIYRLGFSLLKSAIEVDFLPHKLIFIHPEFPPPHFLDLCVQLHRHFKLIMPIFVHVQSVYI